MKTQEKRIIMMVVCDGIRFRKTVVGMKDSPRVRELLKELKFLQRFKKKLSAEIIKELKK